MRRERRLQALLDYVYEKDYEFIVNFFGSARQQKSCDEFDKIVKETVGENCSFVMNSAYNQIDILDLSDRSVIGTIYGETSVGFMRGDDPECRLELYAAYEIDGFYIRNKLVGRLGWKDSWEKLNKYIYFINPADKSLKKYDLDANLIWSSDIPDNNVNMMHLGIYNPINEKLYPSGLFTINNHLYDYHYYEETGKLYGITRPKPRDFKYSELDNTTGEYSVEKVFVIEKSEDGGNELQKLLDFIFGYNVTVAVGEMPRPSDSISYADFSKIIKRIMGEAYDFTMHQTCRYVIINDAKTGKEVGKIYGYLSQGFIRGYEYGSPLTFTHATMGKRLFVRNHEVGMLNDKLNYSEDYAGNFYLIDTVSKSVRKYNPNGDIVWVSDIGEDTTAWEFVYDDRAFDMSRPDGMLVIRNVKNNEIRKYDTMTGKCIW